MTVLSPTALARRMAIILMVSGFCSLVYQVTWLRLLRLVFGASTASTAAVVGIFMGGLGLGGWLFGRRVDRSPRPLGVYSRLELGIAVTAALTPLLVAAVRWIYVSLGGTPVLGLGFGSGLRLGLSVLVLGVPTVLMGGTLPAAVRVVESAGDAGRRRVGLLYGINTVGAVVGTLWATFVSIELVGIRRSLWVAALVNLLIAVIARSLARRVEGEEGEEAAGASGPAASASETSAPETTAPDTTVAAPPARLPLVLAAAALSGFVFFLLELVWYRMLSPLLGGSSYTFGLILAVALAGIGLGGLAYGAGARQRRPTFVGFAVTSALLGVSVAVPWALGDRLAVLAHVLRGLGDTGLTGLALGWTVVTAVVVLPASLVAGYQFPLLVGLLGSGRRDVGREVGLTYAWNTAGAIAGSVAGGFGLLPLLSAPGAWRLAGVLLALVAGGFLVAALAGVDPPRPARRRTLLPALLAVTAVLLLTATGPTAFWRHSAIGAGRFEVDGEGPNALRTAMSTPRADLVWETDGVESSVALRAWDQMSFFINGKSDGSAVGDAGTQVMSGLVGALLHPQPESGLVIGLGTGSSAGWLARVPGMERVDVVELEPAMLEVARRMAPVNENALELANLEVHLGDAREYLLTTPRTYDIIFSEPSNPYRAGISSLFTREFYDAASRRLEDGGLFLQWLQGYEVDSSVVRLAYATLQSVFPHVETWRVHSSDLLLVASLEPVEHDPERVRRRLGRDPFPRALAKAWGVSDLEGFYSGFVAGPELARAVAEEQGDEINTDDLPRIEFGFVRNLGRTGLFSLDELALLARSRGWHRPTLPPGTPADAIDWDLVDDRAEVRLVYLSAPIPPLLDGTGADRQARHQARLAHRNRDHRGTVAAWDRQDQPPSCHADLLMMAYALALSRDARAPAMIERLATDHPVEALAVDALGHLQLRRDQEALERMEQAWTAYRSDPWPSPPLMAQLLDAGLGLTRLDPSTTRRVFELLAEPFSVLMLDYKRHLTRLDIAFGPHFRELCLEALEPLEHPPLWNGTVLARRVRCYQLHDHPRLNAALDDLDTFLAAEPPPLLERRVPLADSLERLEAGSATAATGGRSEARSAPQDPESPEGSVIPADTTPPPPPPHPE